MEAVHSHKILIYFYLTARRHIPEADIPHSRCIGISKIDWFIVLENAGLCVDFELLLYIGLNLVTYKINVKFLI